MNNRFDSLKPKKVNTFMQGKSNSRWKREEHQSNDRWREKNHNQMIDGKEMNAQLMIDGKENERPSNNRWNRNNFKK